MGRSTYRAFEILEIIGTSHKGFKHGQIAQKLDIPKSTLTKIIKDLMSKGYVELDEEAKTYTIGPQILVLARAYLAHLDIVRIAQPIIYEAMTRTKESASLFIRRNNEGIVVLKENSSQILMAMLNIGESVPLYATAAGKALLAFTPDSEIERYLDATPLIPLTSRTISTAERLFAELQQIRRTGLARSDCEQFEDLVALAAPIFGLNNRVVAAISMPYPKSRFTAEKENMIESTLRCSSAEISRKLGADDIDTILARQGGVL